MHHNVDPMELSNNERKDETVGGYRHRFGEILTFWDGGVGLLNCLLV